MTDTSFSTPATSQLAEILHPIDEPDKLDIPISVVTDLILRILFGEGQVSLRRFSDIIKLSSQLLDKILEVMQKEKLVEVASAGSMGRLSYVYGLTEVGSKRSRDALERSQYIGPAPIPIEKYNPAMLIQTDKKLKITPADVKHALRHLILPENFHRRVGPAVAAGTSLFLYGPPGNGKTTVAQGIADLLAGTDGIWVPYALTVGGYIISVYDPLLFEELDSTNTGLDSRAVDQRWGYFKRPAVMVGG